MARSIPSGSHLEFVNIKPLNNLISKCEIKVLYAGKNRNKSYISKEVANKMANTLPGTPIVGEYLHNAEDFKDHGQEELVIDNNGVRFVKETVPFGFVAPDTKIWWANYMDMDGVEREYLVTEGYLWTGRYPESKRVIEKGNNQSMELDRLSLKGEWSKVVGEWSKVDNDNEEYFIINDATFSALCILGEDVEPCFEGANITKSSRIAYSLDQEDFKERMLDFMEDLKYALNNSEGGNGMDELNKDLENTTEEEKVEVEVVVEDEFAKKKKEDEENSKECDPEDKEEDTSDDEEDDEEEEKKKKKNSYSLEEVVEYQELLAKFNELQGQYTLINDELSSIKPEYTKLKELKAKADEEAKTEMINSFYMLSDEDKKEVIENKVNFSLDEIEAKLSVICVRKKVNFDLGDSSKNEDNTEEPILTFNTGDSAKDSTPAWLKAVEARAKNRK